MECLLLLPVQFQGGHTALNKTKTPVLRKLIFLVGSDEL